MSARLLTPGVNNPHDVARVSEIPGNMPFISNVPAVEPAVEGDYNLVKRRPVVRLGNSLQYLFAAATLLFFIVSPGVLNLVHWQYLGGGPEFEKIHLATYFLVTMFVSLWLIDPRFRGNVTELCCTDWTLISFALAVGAVAFYAVLFKHVSIAPFVDTFLAALLVTMGWICLPPNSLIRLRQLLDLYFVVNIAILFIEYAMKSWVIAPGYDGPFRAIAFFENPLSAAALLGVYAIANLASTPIRFTRKCVTRLILGFASLLAIFTTGSRAAIVASVVILSVFAAISIARQVASGKINRAAIIYSVFGFPVAAVFLVALLQSGFLDTILSRFEFDNGSTSTRQIAFDLASNMPSNDVWLGLPAGDVRALAARQADMNLVAIEISWVNFLLTCGWIFTVSLFTTYFMFLVRFVPRYCGAPAILPSIFVLIITAASNGIWAKTTVLTTSLAIILAFFRKPSLSQPAVGSLRLRAEPSSQVRRIQH